MYKVGGIINCCSLLPPPYGTVLLPSFLPPSLLWANDEKSRLSNAIVVLLCDLSVIIINAISILLYVVVYTNW